MYQHIASLEKDIADFTGSPYVVATDCCTHAIEIAFILKQVKHVRFPCRTYLSIPMMCKKIKVDYNLTNEVWKGQYQFEDTNIWDSALTLQPNMYKKGQIQCLSFGNDKPLNAKRGGCILLDNYNDYMKLKMMAYDGRDLSITPWQDQKQFNIGYHYNMSIEHSIKCRDMLKEYIAQGNFASKIKKYPDCRSIEIHG